MTDRELAGCALSEVLALLEKATPGEWRWSMNGNIVPQEYTQDCEIAAVYTEHDELNTEPANSAAICASVNFLRQHGPALLAALSTPSSEGDGRDAERYRRWLVAHPEGGAAKDLLRALLRADEPAVLRAVADYIAASYTPEQEARQDVRRAIEGYLYGRMVSKDGGSSWEWQGHGGDDGRG